MVWDTIYGRGAELEPVEEWGGISYALGALEATLPSDWSIVPLVKVGSDLAPRANEFLSTLTRRAENCRFVEAPQPNNRVTLHYQNLERCAEQMSGGVAAWSWSQLGPMVADLDAIYVNFISGFEMPLETARDLRRRFSGPIYVDLHSLFLGVDDSGMRVPEAPTDVTGWFSCFDIVQLNEDEMGLVGDNPVEVAERALASGVGLFIVTLGDKGAEYYSAGDFGIQQRSAGHARPSAPIRTARVPACHVEQPLDPTGCGDVFGAAAVSYLLRGVTVEQALRQANALAAANLSFRGATELHHHLRKGMTLQ
jgi:sugar/nucleoside kinase (ribokinase family)